MRIPRSTNHKHFNDYPGVFVVLEGIDGSGTTTQARMLSTHLRDLNQPAVFTHEPSDGPVGMLIRLALAGRLRGPQLDIFDVPDFDQSVSEDDDTIWNMETLALLYAADRMDHLSTRIIPSLKKGRVVVCDRYVLSTLAYQGLTGDSDDLAWLVSISDRVLVPDLTLFLDVSPSRAIMRMRQTRMNKDLYEDEKMLELIASRYLKIIDMEVPIVGPVQRINADNAPRTVFNDLVAAIGRAIDQKLGRPWHRQEELFPSDR